MKKMLFLLLFFWVSGTVSSQTVLNRFPLELKKSNEYYQIINAQNASNDYFSFITDKQKTTVLKHNAALFFTDSISVSRPDIALDFMIGATFLANGNPNLYWSSKNFETIKLIHFDFEKHTSSALIYDNDFKREKVIDAFVADNKFNIVSINADNKLKFTTFSNSGKSEQVLVSDSENNSVEPNSRAAISDNGIAVIEAHIFTPLYVGTAKVKRYLNSESYILSIDLDTSTQVFTVNLKNLTLKKEAFPYVKLDKDSQSNSFLHQGILYQISAHSESISLTGVDLKTNKVIETYQAKAKQEIEFKNTPLFLQSESGKSRELKKTAQLLSKMDDGTVGLSVYATPNYNLFTIGGVRSVASTGSITLGIGIIVAGAIGGGIADPSFLGEKNNLQSIFFESYFDTNFKHVKMPFQTLYIDALNAFLSENYTTVQNVYPYKNYVILNYYDRTKKEFVMRKFEDEFN